MRTMMMVILMGLSLASGTALAAEKTLLEKASEEDQKLFA